LREKMSQSQPSAPTASSTGRIALAIGIVGLVLGASGLGYAVYLGQSQIPSQISTLSVNVKPSDKTIRVEWETALNSGQDRFFPEFITVVQGDNLTIVLITNDTSDGHTFTIGLGMRNLPTSAVFQLNNSWTGQTTGPYIKPFHPAPNGLDCCLANGGRYNPEFNFTGIPTGCTDQNGNSYTCNTKNTGGGSTYACNAYAPSTAPVPCSQWSSGWLGVVTVPGVYKFFCFFHQSAGMIGYLTVLPNSYKP
jgi:plastocyanin